MRFISSPSTIDSASVASFRSSAAASAVPLWATVRKPQSTHDCGLANPRASTATARSRGSDYASVSEEKVKPPQYTYIEEISINSTEAEKSPLTAAGCSGSSENSPADSSSDLTL
jgi:hypothetical protein